MALSVEDQQKALKVLPKQDRDATSKAFQAES